MAQVSDTADSLHSSFNKTSSDSSVSISCSYSSDTADDNPSTSGCSSEMMKNSRSKARKKEKVKEYLKELKLMVSNSKSKPDKASTLSTLQHVINSMRRINGEPPSKDPGSAKTSKTSKTSIASEYSASREDLESGFHSINTQQIIDEELVIPSTQDSIIIVLSVWLGIIEDISENAKAILGYPKDLILGRPLSDFISKRDQAAFRSILSVDVANLQKAEKATEESESVQTEDSQKKITYFHIRKYKSLEQGFHLNPTDKFIPYQAIISLKNKNSYEPVATGKSVMPMESDDAPHGSIWSSVVRRGQQPYLALECIPLKTAYLSPQSVPENATFCTRHTLYCCYSYIHSNAIPLLGYLPQDMIGSSVFDYYHPDDLTQLYNNYQQVLSMEGKTIKSKAYRWRVKNGDYILVETEWSIFINPWSRKLEFVIGQHTVVRGPDNPDVFLNAEFPKKNIQEGVYTQALKMQQKIQNLFLKPIKCVPKSSLKSHMDEDKDKQSKTVSFDVGMDLDNPDNLQERVGPYSPAVSLPPSPSHLGYDPESVLTYKQLNYKQNISRFLLSQPKTFSSEQSDKKSSCSPGEKEPGEEELSDELFEAFQVHFPIPKPPSFGSSTKVLVLEQEPREEVREDAPNASPTREEPMKDTVAPSVNHELELTSPAMVEVPEIQHQAYLPVTLTQDMLRAHTKRQEKLYVQQASQDSSYLSASLSPTLFKTPHRHKRLLSSDLELDGRRMFKAPRVLHTSTSPSTGLASFPVTTADSFQPQSSVTQVTAGQYHQSTVSRCGQLMGLHGLYSQSLPILQNTLSCSMSMDVSQCSARDVHDSQQMISTMQNLPYYMPTDLSFGQLYNPLSKHSTYSSPANTHCTYSLMSSQQNPVMLASRKPTTQSSSPSTISTVPKYERKKQLTRRQYMVQSGKQLTHRQHMIQSGKQLTRRQHMVQSGKQTAGNSSSGSSDNMSSLGETYSSLLYLLESGSHNFSSSQEELESTPKVQCQQPELPPWQIGAKWTDKVEKRYSRPKRKLEQVLKEDREKSAGFTQSETSREQLMEMLDHRSNPSSAPTMDQEADHLFYSDKFEMELGEFDLASVGSKHSIDICGNNHNHGISTFELPSWPKSGKCTKKHKKKDHHKEKRQKNIVDKDPTNMETQKEYDEYKNKQEDGAAGSPGKCSDNMELGSNWSKESSNLTPSDQRSSEEAQSSLKESDTASKEKLDSSSHEQKELSGSENEFQAVEGPDFFDQTFVSLEVKFPQLFGPCKLNKASSWILESKFSRNVEMKYQLQMRPLASVLERDRKMLEEMVQPSNVRVQLDELRSQIMDNLSTSFKLLQGGPNGESGKDSTPPDGKGSSQDDRLTPMTSAISGDNTVKPPYDIVLKSIESPGHSSAEALGDREERREGAVEEKSTSSVGTHQLAVDSKHTAGNADMAYTYMDMNNKMVMVESPKCPKNMHEELVFSELFLPFPWDDEQSFA